MTETDYSMRDLLISLGYSFESSTPPAYSFCLALRRAKIDKLKIVQLVTLAYPEPNK
ncbi:hypothetical protein J3455_11880 [Pseudoalteromonas sp. NFXS39]|uniref:hypothetical protein n=1 Tax=Pseudoalteromonas sp. NFXS39 TaxID=2818437 RepID=UPI0032E00361